MGRRDSPTRCPVSLAVARAQGGGVVSLYPSTILSTKGVFETPDEVWMWVSAFEQNRPVGPFKFVLEEKLEPYPMPDRWPPFLYE